VRQADRPQGRLEDWHLVALPWCEGKAEWQAGAIAHPVDRGAEAVP
jgi:hypothetical protein